MQVMKALAAVVIMTGALRAQIDPSIPLRVNPPNIPNALDNALKIQQIREMQERTRQLEEQTRQIAEQRAAAQRKEQDAEAQRAKAPAGPNLTMRGLLGAEGFNLVGLNLLNEDQVAFLDKWISAYSVALAQRFSTPVRQPQEAVESEIRGDFHGWSGDTVFELENGQVWKQSAYDYEYDYEYNPKVVIYPMDSVFKMKVDGVKGTVEVRRLK
jgi:hypothetical protein